MDIEPYNLHARDSLRGWTVVLYIDLNCLTSMELLIPAEIPSELPLKHQPAKFRVRPPRTSLDAPFRDLDRNGLEAKSN